MKTFNNFLTEALSPHHEDIVRRWVGPDEPAGKKLSEHVFKGKEILHYPLQTEDAHDTPIHPDVKSHLEKFGYTIPTNSDYHAGYAVDKHSRITSIGKALKKTKADSQTVSAFENDPNRTAANKSKLNVSYTWEPHHVAGMSTDRGWTSCMDMDHGTNKAFLAQDIAHGTHVAYLTHADDTKIERPLARIALKPYTSEHGHTILRPEGKTYGTAKDSFSSHVDSWANTHFPASEGVQYDKHPEVYNDSLNETYLKHSESSIRNLVPKAIDGSAPSAMRGLRDTENIHSLTKHILAADADKADKALALNAIIKNNATASKTLDTIVDAHHKDDLRTNSNSIHAMVVAHPRMSPASVGKVVDIGLKYHSRPRSGTFEPGSDFMSNPHLTKEHVNKIVDHYPMNLTTVHPSKTTPELVDKYMNELHSEHPVFGDIFVESAHTSGIIQSKHFKDEHIRKLGDKLINNNRHASLMRGVQNMADNPNFTVEHARYFDAKSDADGITDYHMSIMHRDSTIDDLKNRLSKAQDGVLKTQNITRIKNGELIDHMFNDPKHQEHITSAYSSYAAKPPRNTKNYGTILASYGRAADNEHDVRAILHSEPSKLLKDNVRSIAKRTIASVAGNVADNPAHHPDIVHAMNTAIANDDPNHLHAIVHRINSKVPVPKATVVAANKLRDDHGMKPYTEHDLKISND